jgi:protein-S-isoprenylcysteine O-methyltransferase Ste14
MYNQASVVGMTESFSGNKKTRLLVLFLTDQVLSLLGMGIALFWSAGRIDWWAAWAAIAVWVIWFIAQDIILFRYNPDLAAERLSPPKSAKKWDTAIVITLRLMTLARYILAGLDQRYGWTGDVSLTVHLAGLTLCVLGYGLFGWAMASNQFFSQVVRVQTERGHTVATRGPYRFVRHPSYIGGSAFELGMGMLLGSWVAFLAGGACALLLIIRTGFEDRTLQAELPGYRAYARQVRYRLIPGIW